MSRARTFILIAGIGILAALLGALLAHSFLSTRSAPPALASGTALQPPLAIPPFSLVDQDGEPYRNERLLGHWSLLFFGFTNCGDVCPTTLALLAAAIKTLHDLPEPSRPHVVFFSVDSKRDTPEIVKGYVRTFDPTFSGVTGMQENVDALTAALGVPSAIRPLENGGYAVDHSAAILVVNPQGQVAAIFTPPHTVDALANDYRALIGKS